ncbi:hypothetical protein E2320_011643 [Naja naja]|nr:hypothetical protein E2320_011643 [Naja naja]
MERLGGCHQEATERLQLMIALTMERLGRCHQEATGRLQQAGNGWQLLNLGLKERRAVADVRRRMAMVVGKAPTHCTYGSQAIGGLYFSGNSPRCHMVNLKGSLDHGVAT